MTSDEKTQMTEKAILEYYNEVLCSNSVISETQRNKIKLRIDTRPSHGARGV